MWKWILGAVAATVLVLGALAFYLSDKIYPRFPHAAVAAADFERRWTPAQLQADFDALVATVEHIHPDVAAIVDGATYEANKGALRASLVEPMTRTQFFRVLAPFVGSNYNEGHTEIIAPTEEWRAYVAGGGKAPPFAVEVKPSHLRVVRTVDESSPPVDAEIESINGVGVDELSRWLLSTQSVETQAGREVYAAARFHQRLWSYGILPPFTVVWKAPDAGATHTVQLAGVAPEAWERARAAGGGEPVSLAIENGVAHLVIRDFEMPWDRYEAWYRDAFTRIRDAKADSLVLDLRDNSGGDSRQSDLLQTYLSDDFLPAIASVEVKTTPEVKAMYQSLLPEGFRWIPLHRFVPELRGIVDAPDDGVFRFSPEGESPVPRKTPNPLAFHGDLYLLVGPYTYSTAMIAAAPYKYWKRATVVGQRTAEGLTFFGDYYEFDLPNSKIQMHVSHKTFRLVGSGGRNSQIEPDVATDADHPDAWPLALDVIARRRAAAGRGAAMR